MASPLLLRVALKDDVTPGLRQVSQNVRDFSSSLEDSSAAATDSFDAYDKMNAALAGVAIQSRAAGAEGGQAFSDLQKGARALLSSVRLIRREIFFAGFLALPFILAAKAAIDTEKQITELTNKLALLGQSGSIAGQQLGELAASFSSRGLIANKDTLASLDILIEKTKSAANAEQVLSLAQKLHAATGIKTVDATKAIADALTGNVAALANLTQSTKFEIAGLVENGDVLQVLNTRLKDVANQGASTFSGRLEALGIALKQNVFNAKSFIETLATLARVPRTALGAGPIFDAARTFLQQTSEIKSVSASLEKVSQVPVKFDFRSLEGLQLGIGQLTDRAQLLIKALTTPGVSAATVQNIRKILSPIRDTIGALRQQLKEEERLSGFENERLSANGRLIASQTELDRIRANRRITGEAPIIDEEKRLIELAVDRKREVQLAELFKEAADKRQAQSGILSATQEADFRTRLAKTIQDSEIEKERQFADATSKNIAHLNELKKAEIDLAEFQSKLNITPGRGLGGLATFGEDPEELKKQFLARKELRDQEAVQQLQAAKAQGASAEQLQAILKKNELLNEQDAVEVAKRIQEFEKLPAAERQALQKSAREGAESLQRTLTEFGLNPNGRELQLALADIVAAPVTGSLDKVDEAFAKLQAGLPDRLKALQDEVRTITDQFNEAAITVKVNLATDKVGLQQVADETGTAIAKSIWAKIVAAFPPLASALNIAQGPPTGGSE